MEVTKPPADEPNDPFDDILYADPAAKREAKKEDKEDLKQARKAPEECTPRRPWWQRIGPGFVTGAANNDPVGVGTYSVAGARFSYSLSWVMMLALPLMIAIQEMCGRLAAITAKGLAGVMRDHFHPAFLWGAVVLLTLANTISVWADLNVMASSAQLVIHLPFPIWLTIVTVATVGLLIFIPYRVYVRYLKWLTLAMLAYIVTALLPSLHVDWGRALHSFLVPSWNGNSAYLMIIVGMGGTSISPYLFFWQSGETVEEEVAEGKADAPGDRVERLTRSEIGCLRLDTVIGMIVSVMISTSVILCAAAALHAKGQTNIQTAADVARALTPLGPAAHYIFTLAILAAGLLAVPALSGSAAYAIAEAAGWRYGLYRRPSRAMGFYLTIVGVVLIGFGLNFIGSVKPVQALMIASVLNGIVAPPLIAILLLICNNRKIMGKRFNRWPSNVFGGLAVLVMTTAAGFLLWNLASGAFAK